MFNLPSSSCGRRRRMELNPNARRLRLQYRAVGLPSGRCDLLIPRVLRPTLPSASAKDYAAIENEVTTLIGRVNGRYGEASWTPIRYVNRSHSRTALSGIYRAADVALVTPLRDGMNLVAKEYVAAQDPENPGVLVLSQFAGAAAELTRALIVNPHDSEAVAAALKRALEMPLAERRERHGPMLEHLMVHDVEHWAESYLSALAETRQRPGLMSDLRAFLTPSWSRG